MYWILTIPLPFCPRNTSTWECMKIICTSTLTRLQGHSPQLVMIATRPHPCEDKQSQISNIVVWSILKCLFVGCSQPIGIHTQIGESCWIMSCIQFIWQWMDMVQVSAKDSHHWPSSNFFCSGIITNITTEKETYKESLYEGQLWAIDSFLLS